MSHFSKWWNRRPTRGSSSLGRRFRAEVETLEDRATPSGTPTNLSLEVIVFPSDPLPPMGAQIITSSPTGSRFGPPNWYFPDSAPITPTPPPAPATPSGTSTNYTAEVIGSDTVAENDGCWWKA